MAAEIRETYRFRFADIFFLGFTLLGAQIILLREFLLVFNGNELVVGLLFSIWMITTAAGAWAGRYSGALNMRRQIIRALLVFIAAYPLAAAFSIEYFRNIVFAAGRMISLYEAIAYAAVLLFPLCFAGGFLFTALNFAAGSGGGRFQNCYAVESLGSLAGGMLVSLFFIYRLEAGNFKSLTYLLLINFVYFGIADFKRGKELSSFAYLISAIAIMFFIYQVDLGYKAKEMMFRGQELIFTKETAYGNLSITRTGNQLNVYRDGLIYFSGENVIGREEDVHYAMLQKPEARNVLQVGGGMTGTIQEVLKYPLVKNITYLEMDPVLFTFIDDEPATQSGVALATYSMDPLTFIRQTTDSFDVVLIHQPPPSNAQINRYYTVNFFYKAKRVITAGGVLSTRLPSSGNYLSNEEVAMQAAVYNSLSRVFRHVLVVPGEQTYFVASDDSVEMNYSKMLSRISPRNEYVNSHYLNDDLMRYRAAQMLSTYAGHDMLNTDLKPVVYLTNIRHWLNLYGFVWWVIPAVTLVLTLAMLIFAKPGSLAIFTSGFTGAGAEVVLIIVFQVLLGYVYLFIGVLITLFMAGLAAGAYLSNKVTPRKPGRNTLLLQLLSGAIIAGIPAVLLILGSGAHPEWVQIILSATMLMTAMLVGLQYGYALSDTPAASGKTVSRIYASDLLGSAIGSLAVVVFLIPVAGIYTTLWCLGGLHFLTGLLILFKRKIKYL